MRVSARRLLLSNHSCESIAVASAPARSDDGVTHYTPGKTYEGTGVNNAFWYTVWPMSTPHLQRDIAIELFLTFTFYAFCFLYYAVLSFGACSHLTHVCDANAY